MVRLQRIYFKYKKLTEESLNSTMVRLQLRFGDPSKPNVKQSQFHYGSITTKVNAKMRSEKMIVSIPLWFDYNNNGSSKDTSN